MNSSEELKAALKSAKLSLMACFVLKNQGKLIQGALAVLIKDMDSNPHWYKEPEQKKLVFNLQDFLRRLLRFIRINLKVTDLVPMGLADLRRGRSLCNITGLRLRLTNFTSELQVILFTSSLHQRLPIFNSYFSGEKVAEAFENDSEMIKTMFGKVFQGLVKIFPEEVFLSKFNANFVGKISGKNQLTFDDVNSTELANLSYQLEQKLFTLTSNEPTEFSSLQMEKNTFLKGKFGKIVNGKLSGISMVCVQEVNKKQLETLSSDGRVKLFSTLRTTSLFTHESMVNIEGISVHQGSLYIIHEKIYYTLDDLLHPRSSEQPRLFTAEEIVAIFLSISKALEKIHKDGMVHGDIRPSNIFFTRKMGPNGVFSGFAKLAYFTYELNLNELHWSTWADEGLLYQAPEVLGDKKFTSASDMFSLAVTLWEAIHEDQRPYSDFSTNGDLVAQIKKGTRPGLELTNADENIVDIIVETWGADACSRLSAATWVSKFEGMMEPQAKNHMYDFINDTLKRRNQRQGNMPHQSYTGSGSNQVGHSGSLASKSIAGTENRPITAPGQPARPAVGPRGSFKPVMRPIEPVKPVKPVIDTKRELIDSMDTLNEPSLFRPPPPPPPTPGPGPPMPARHPVDSDMPPPMPNRDAIPRPVSVMELPPDLPDRTPPRPISIEPANQRFPRPQADAVEQSKPGKHSTQVIEQELRRFYEEKDAPMLNQLDGLIAWCVENSLEEFNELLLRDFDEGLYIFRKRKSEKKMLGRLFGGGGASRPPGL